MEIYLDLEKTLLNENGKINQEGLQLLEEISLQHSITILTTSIYEQIPKEILQRNIKIVSTLENKLFKQGKEIYDPLDNEQINKVLKSPYIYTAYTILNNETQILNYQERLKYFYPTSSLKLVQQIDFPISFVVLAVQLDGETEILNELKNYHIRTLAKDMKRIILLITSSNSSKASWLQRLKKSPAIGIGDSLEDYEFIKHCQIKVAMKNGDIELQNLCSFHTTQTNNENGALYFILDFLKHQQV